MSKPITVSSCGYVHTEDVNPDVELRAAAVKAWEHIVRGMLLGKVIWNVRTKKLLGVIEAPPGAAPIG